MISIDISNKAKTNLLHTTWVELTAVVDITRYEALGSVVHQYSMVWPMRGFGGGITDDRVKTIISSVVTIQPSQEYEWSHGRYLVDIIYNRTDRELRADLLATWSFILMIALRASSVHLLGLHSVKQGHVNIISKYT